MDTGRGISLGVKRPGSEADHLSSSGAEVKNDGAIQYVYKVPSGF
jgi:hypothetical protein